ncbi:hypothetical protein ABPG74_009117 [Tetrahymena malaccensis]
MEDQYQTSPNNKDSMSRKSDARLLTDNKLNAIIADLIEKTKILAEELKNSNKIAAELMLQNSELRKKYSNLKDKFLQFLNDEEIIDYMESDHNMQQSNGIIFKLKQYENSVQNLKTDNINLEAINQQQKQQISDLQVKINNLEKSTKASEILKSIDQNKDMEIQNLKEQIRILQDQLSGADQSHQQSQQEYVSDSNYYPNQIQNNYERNNQQQPKEKMTRAYSQIQLGNYDNNNNNLNSIKNNANFMKKQLNQQQIQNPQSAYNSSEQFSGRDFQNNFNNHQMSNIPSQQNLENQSNGIYSNNSRKPLQQKNSYYNRNFNEYNELLYSEQNNENLDLDFYQQSQQREEQAKNAQQYHAQNRQYQNQQSVQMQQQHGHYNNTNNQKQQNLNTPQTVFNTTLQYTSENQENNGSFENRYQNSTESNRLILSGGAGKSLIDPHKPFGRHQKSPSYIDPQAAAKYARSTVSLKKNQPTQKGQTMTIGNNKKKI